MHGLFLQNNNTIFGRTWALEIRIFSSQVESCFLQKREAFSIPWVGNLNYFWVGLRVEKHDRKNLRGMWILFEVICFKTRGALWPGTLGIHQLQAKPKFQVFRVFRLLNCSGTLCFVLSIGGKYFRNDMSSIIFLLSHVSKASLHFFMTLLNLWHPLNGLIENTCLTRALLHKRWIWPFRTQISLYRQIVT